MNKIIQIAGRTLSSNLNFKAMIYVFFILITSILFFYFNVAFFQSFNDLRTLNAAYSTAFLSMALVWMLGIPAFFYFGYLLANSISEDINSGIALLIFTRPITRREFLLGRFLGLFTFFNIIHFLLLFSFPAIANIFLGVQSVFLFSMFKVSFALFPYTILLSFAFASFGILLSTGIRKSLFSLAILFGCVLFIFVLPIILSLSGKPDYAPVIKPFYHVVKFFNLDVFSSVGVGLTYSYLTSGDIIIENFSSGIYTILFSLVIPILLIVLAVFNLSREDIT